MNCQEPAAARKPNYWNSLLRSMLLLLALLPATAFAQNFDGARFLDQCLRLEAGGDLISARESCLNALELDGSNSDALLALARLEIRLGDLSSAENRLLQLRARVVSAEPALLLAEIALERNDRVMAESYLGSAASQLVNTPNAELEARQAWLLGRTLEAQGLDQEALGNYRRASATQPLEIEYYKSAARVLLDMGLPEAAAEELLQYRSAAGQRGDAELHSLLGESLWASGRLEAAANEYEAAFALRAGRDAEAQAADLRSLTAIYYGMGDTTLGGAALSDALSQGNLVKLLAGNTLMWLLVLLLLAGVHLVSEGQHQEHQTVEVSDGPGMWSITRVYSVLVWSALLGLAAVLAWSILVLRNFTAVFTPLQAGQVKAVFIIVFVLAAVIGSWLTVRRHGWNPAEKLLGRGEHVAPGIVLGLLLLGLVAAWQLLVPAGFLKGAWHFELGRLTGITLAAICLLPLGEIFFRSFAIPALARRYSANIAVPIAAALYALVLGTPVVLSLVIGLVLGTAFLRIRSGLLVISAQLVLQLGLVLLNMLWAGLSAVLA